MATFLTGDAKLARFIRKRARPVRGALRQKFGIDVVPASAVNGEAIRREVLARLGVDLVVDVGANAGGYATALRSAGYEGAIVSVEPAQAAFAALEQAAADDPFWGLAQLALGEESGEAVLNLAGNAESSSLLAMLPAHVEAAPDSAYVGAETVAVRRLDDLLAEVAPGAARAYVKIDAQGYEDRIIAGSARALDAIAAFEVEVSFSPLYEGQKLFPEVLALLTGLGFDLAYLEPGFADRASLRLLGADAFFVRRAFVKAAEPRRDAPRLAYG